MLLIATGAFLIIAGIALAAARTASRGQLSEQHPPVPGTHPDTLEPRGRGARLSLKADLPGIALVVVGAILMFAGAFF